MLPYRSDAMGRPVPRTQASVAVLIAGHPPESVACRLFMEALIEHLAAEILFNLTSRTGGHSGPNIYQAAT